jgi:predicted DNA-binding transcriptional regulator AlpA
MTKRQPTPAEFDLGALHDDALLGSSKAARFLQLPDSTFYLLRKKMGRDFPRPVLTCGRPRYRVGTLREWLRRLESQSAPTSSAE